MRMQTIMRRIRRDYSPHSSKQIISVIKSAHHRINLTKLRRMSRDQARNEIINALLDAGYSYSIAAATAAAILKYLEG